MSEKKPKVFLIDGSSYIYRAFFAIAHLSNSKGFPTNAIYGFTNMLLKVLREKGAEYAAIAFDAGAHAAGDERGLGRQYRLIPGTVECYSPCGVDDFDRCRLGGRLCPRRHGAQPRRVVPRAPPKAYP